MWMSFSDREVSELTQDAEDSSSDSETGHPSHLPAELELTTESVKAFMKKVDHLCFCYM